MARARGPVGYTCPKIDSVIKAVTRAIQRCYQGDAENAIDDLADVEATMEVIRDANDQLRDWGSGQEDIVAEHEQEICDLERKVANLEDEVAELKRELESALAEAS